MSVIICCFTLEVNTINKQKFLAELGRLLTFMYEEDRQTALSMYTRLFDMADDEQAVLHFLVSPTRQAVLLARTYDAAERKLQVHSQHRDASSADSGELPPFVSAIEALEREALSLGVTAPLVDENQFSLFESDAPVDSLEASDLSQPSAAAAYGKAGLTQLEPVSGQDSSPSPIEAVPVVPPAPAEAPASSGEPVLQAGAEAVSGSADAAASIPSASFEQSKSSQDAVSPPASSAADSAPASEAPASENEETQAAPSEEDKVDAFLAGFSIADEPVQAAAPAAPDGDMEDEAMPALDALDDPVPAPVETVSRACVPLLIVYILFASVVGLAALLLLLVPLLLSLSVAFVSGSVGIGLLSSAFASFAIFADFLAVFGASLLVLAVALLFAWLFIWLIGGVIIGMIRALCRLGRKWCYKEVAVS